MAAAAATAAAEAPRSSSSSSSGGGGSADSYIGSLISLTSKSEIRYEGVLYNINALESTIGLRNVRSFGTEGRKKDGPQVPPSDKIYEFILFRGSDIKDLQVKSSPPVQTTTPVHSDPAIIQSQYPQATSASVALPSSGTSNPTDDGSHTSLLGLPRPSFQGSLPLYQPGGSLSSWGSTPPPPTTNPSGLAVPMYWQGYYGPSNGLQAQQQTFLQPTPGLSMPPPMQPPMQCPPFNASNIPASQLSENPPPKPLLPPFSVSAQNFQAPMLPVQSTGIVSEPANLTLDKPPNQTLPTAPLNSNLPLTSPSPPALDKSAIPPSDSDLPKVVPDRAMPSTNVPEAQLSVMGTSSSVFNEGGTPPLVTPGQFLQPGLSAVPSIQFSETSQKDVEVVQVSSEELPPPASTVAITDVQEPILPLPSPPEHKLHRAPMYSYHANRGRARGRGNEISRSATTFTEDFDFTAMNEKFNKDEIWGDLGKSNKAQDENYSQEDDAGSSKLEVKPVYVKDDFFDSLSCDALDGRSSNGRGRFSEQVRRDTETFGDFPRHRGGRGGWGPGRGGRSRGGYYGRGYYYGGRGRGYYNNMSRAI